MRAQNTYFAAVSRRAGLAIALAGALALSSCAAPSDTSPDAAITPQADTAAPGAFTVVADSLDADLSAALAEAGAAAFEETSSPGAVMAVSTADGTWVSRVGFDDWAETEPMAADVYQRVGSVTKTYVVTALMQLAEEGAVSLDDPIEKYQSGLPNGSATLAQLAEMRSGIPSYTFNDEFVDTLFAEPDKQWLPEELVDLVRDEPAMFAPGEAMFYSNTNTVLLGLVIEEVTGQALNDVISEKILQPLGLSGTSFPVDASYPDPHPQGYSLQGLDDVDIAEGIPQDVTDMNPSWGWAAGAMISTIDDLLAWGQALGTGEGILSPDMQELRLNSFDFSVPIWAGPDDRIEQSPARAYGMGLGLALDWYGHEGEMPGYNAYVQYYEPEGMTIAVMTNSDIHSGECADGVPTAENNPGIGACQTPASRMGEALAGALGHPLVE